MADRIELHTADMRALPFPDASFDVVVSSLAIHNIKGSAGRNQAIDEVVRVLRPGGRVLIVDIFATRQLFRPAESVGPAQRGPARPGHACWVSGPWVVDAACLGHEAAV